MRKLVMLVGVAAIMTGGAALAEVTPLDLQTNHPNGSILIVRGIEVGSDAIRLDVTVTTADREIRLANNNAMILVDDQSGVYRLIPPPDNQELTVPANSRLTGELYFSGRLAPAAQRLVLTTNDGVGGSADNRFSSMPVFRVELPAPGQAGAPGATAPPVEPAAAPAAAAAPVEAASVPAARSYAVSAQAQHANGTTLIVEGIEAGEDGILLSIRATTATQESRLNANDSTQLVDDQGNVYRLVPPSDNQELAVPAGSRIAGQIAFSGRLRPDATRLTLLVNERGGGRSSRSNVPEFRLALPLGG